MRAGERGDAGRDRDRARWRRSRGVRDGAGERDDFSFERRGAEAHGARVVGEAARVVDLLIGRVDR